jgi:hypothetical protein
MVASPSYLYSMNTITILYSTLILALVSIPRFFAYLYVHDVKTDYFRRHGYYIVRATTCALLILIQLAMFLAMVYFLV